MKRLSKANNETKEKADTTEMSRRVTHGEMLELRRWNTPTIYNGWEQITSHDIADEGFNIEETIDFMPQMGPMVGRAITVVIEPSNPKHSQNNPNAWADYRQYVMSVTGPKIVVVQDLDKPNVIGAFWGEVNSNLHRAMGCVGTITDGAIRDVDEINYAGFKALARRLCVAHAYSCPVKWGCEVEVFGRRVESEQLVHADKHGFMIIPLEDEGYLLESARFMDTNECLNIIAAARETAGLSTAEVVRRFTKSSADFSKAVKNKFNDRGEF